MFKFWIIVSLCFFTISSYANPSSDKVLLILGDSLSTAYGISKDSSWVNLLDNKIRRAGYPIKVVNSSISGSTTLSGVQRLQIALRQYNPEIVFIELGGNDGLRGIPLTEIRHNLNQMITMAKSAGAKVLLAGMKIPPNYGARYADAFHEIYISLGADNNIHVIPFLLSGIGGNDDYMQADGIHPNERAQPVIMQLIWESLEPMIDSL